MDFSVKLRDFSVKFTCDPMAYISLLADRTSLLFLMTWLDLEAKIAPHLGL